jgi:phospholipid/cholesterol/gamma-HCH transport system permease protein
MLDRFGRATTNFFEYAGGLTLLSLESASFLVRLRIRFAETVSQCALLGVQSWIIVVLTSLFTGMVISLESAQQAVQYGVGSLVGGAVAYGTVRELGPMLTIFADVVSILGGMWIAFTYAHISYDTFMASVRQTIGFEDVVKGLLKALVFAVIIAMVGAYQGLSTTGGAAGVGKSTTSAVVLSIILIFISNFVLSFLLFGGN